jgi:glycosyltransferase involved in cell wall biosynthesis
MSKQDISVSIVVPVYKTEEGQFRRCLNSLIFAKETPVEIILIDDGSPDNCGAICDEYAQMDNRICVIHKENQGVSIARNVGIDSAKGNWICFVDADDWVETDYFSIMMPYLSLENDVVFFNYYENNEKSIFIDSTLAITILSKKTDLLETMLLGKYGAKYGKYSLLFSAPWAKMISRNFLRKNAIYFESDLFIKEDAVFMIDVMVNNPCITHSEGVFYHYMVNKKSVSHKYDARIKDWNRMILSHICQRVDCVGAMQNVVDKVTIQLLLTECNSMYFFHPYNKSTYIKKRDEYLEHINSLQIKLIIKKIGLFSFGFAGLIVLISIRLNFVFLLNFIYKLRYAIKYR